MRKIYFLLICGLMCVAMGLRAANYDINSGNVTIPAGTESHTITGNGSTTANRIVVSTGYNGTITLTNVDITSTNNCAFSIQGTSVVTLKLVGSNSLTSGVSGNTAYAGILVPEGATLIIEDGVGDGTGKLIAKGGSNSSSYGGGAGIGSNGVNGTASGSGQIVINSGIIEATGGQGGQNNSGGGAGIGGGGGGGGGGGNWGGGAHGSIIINGGVVTAKGGNGGGSNNGGGGAGIGGGGGGGNGSGGGSTNAIEINDGTVTVQGGHSSNNGAGNGGGGAGVGGGGGAGNNGLGGAAGNITIMEPPATFNSTGGTGLGSGAGSGGGGGGSGSTTISASSLMPFGTLAVGYSSPPAAQTVTITNTGTTQITTLAVSSSSTNFTLGTLSATTIAAGSTATFTVQPVTGIAAGIHTAIITINSNAPAVTVNATFTVTAAPTIAVTSTGLTGLKVDQPVNGSILFTITNGVYEDPIIPVDFIVSGLPAGLSAGAATRTNNTVVTVPITGTPTTYDAAGATLTIPAIPAGNVTGVSTAIIPTGAITIPVAKGDGAAVSEAPAVSGTPTYTSITVGAVTIPVNNSDIQSVEYAISTSTTPPASGWQSGTTFNPLTAGTSYYVFARTQASTNYNAGTAQVSAAILTQAAPTITVAGAWVPATFNVGESATLTVTYTLASGVYAGTITAANFDVTAGIPAGFTAGTADRTNDNVVTLTITGTSTAANAAAYNLTVPATIPAANVAGWTVAAVAVSGTVSVNAIGKGVGAAVSVPVINGVPTVNSITVNAVTVSGSTGQSAEYAISTTNGTPPASGWQAGTTFNSLTAGTTYYVYARSAENTNYYAGLPQESTGIKTYQTPLITGPATMDLLDTYAGSHFTGTYTITGEPAPTVTLDNDYSGDIVWDATNRWLEIKPGFAVGSYPVTLTASNGVTPDATCTFTLTVSNTPVAPGITGPSSMELVAGYTATSSSAFSITGTDPVTVTLDNNYGGLITWNNTGETLDIAAGLGQGSYPVVLTASNGTSPDATYNFTLTVKDPITISAINGVTVPVEGATPVSSITGTTQFTGTVLWFPNDNPFVSGNAYTATIQLTALSPYSYADLPANFFSVSGTTSTSFDASTGKITATFPTLVSATIKSVNVGIQNGKITTTAGGSANYAVTTENIVTALHSVTLLGAPAGVTIGNPSSNINISGNSGTLTLNVASGVATGTYQLRVTINGATSNYFTLYVAPNGATFVTGITVTGVGGATSITTNGGVLQMIANVSPSNATNPAVFWSVANGTGSATISSTGLLVPVTNSNGKVIVRASAVDGSFVYGELEIDISGQDNTPYPPNMYGATSLTLNRGYQATSTSPYTFSGTTPITVTKTSGDGHITWNSTTNALDIAPGLAVGAYEVKLRVENSVSNITFTFTLTVEEPQYFIEIGTYIGGSVSSVSHAPYLGWEGETVTLNITHEDGYDLEAIHAYNMYNRSIEIPLTGTGLTRTFKMPAHHVTIVAAFRDPRGVGIEETQFITSLQANAQSGTLYVSGLTAGQQWKVYNITGTLVYQGIAGDEKAQITLPGRGIYIVTDGKKTIKVAN